MDLWCVTYTKALSHRWTDVLPNNKRCESMCHIPKLWWMDGDGRSIWGYIGTQIEITTKTRCLVCSRRQIAAQPRSRYSDESEMRPPDERRSLGHYCPPLWNIYDDSHNNAGDDIIILCDGGDGRGGISERSLPLQNRNREAFQGAALSRYSKRFPGET